MQLDLNGFPIATMRRPIGPAATTLTSMNGQTGIEIQVGLTPGQKVIGKLLHAAHLDVIGRAVAQGSTAVIEVDGRRTEEPFYEAHFIACEPGEHTVEMFMQGKGPGSDAIANKIYGANLSTTVEDGQVSVLLYTPKDGVGATLTFVETRPA
ncbi:hypothetical protein GCM10010533_48350 [Mycolicibacterium pallens]